MENNSQQTKPNSDLFFNLYNLTRARGLEVTQELVERSAHNRTSMSGESYYEHAQRIVSLAFVQASREVASRRIKNLFVGLCVSAVAEFLLAEPSLGVAFATSCAAGAVFMAVGHAINRWSDKVVSAQLPNGDCTQEPLPTAKGNRAVYTQAEKCLARSDYVMYAQSFIPTDKGDTSEKYKAFHHGGDFWKVKHEYDVMVNQADPRIQGRDCIIVYKHKPSATLQAA